MYCVLEALQNEMSFQPLLFDRGREYVLDLSKITEPENYTYVYREAIEMIKRLIHYDWKGENGKMNDTTTAIISSVTRERGGHFQFCCISVQERIKALGALRSCRGL
jgi:hypothetical protein